MPLPPNLTPEQQQAALAIMREAEPYLTVIHIQLRQTLVELHNLSFASDTPLTPWPSSGAGSSACVPRPYGNCSAFPHKWKSSPVQSRLGRRVRGTKMEDLNPQPLNEQSVE